MSRIRLGKWTIRTARSLKIKLIQTKIEARQMGIALDANKTYWRLVGVYDTRLCGLVFYRNDRLFEFN